MAGTRIGYLTRVIRHGEPPYPCAKPAVLVHGTLNGYSYHACRCEECREAHRTHAREYRAKPKTWPNCAHGRNATYICGCRCDLCRKAHAAYRRAWYARCRRKPRPTPLDARHAARLAYYRGRYQQIKAGTWRKA